MTGGFVYYLIYVLVSIGFFFWHPIYRVKGRENVPKSGRLVICANHSGMADPFWVCKSLHIGHIPRIMAKKESLSYPVVGKIMSAIGVFGVDREVADVNAIKVGIRALKNEEQLLIFPEGTRVRNRADSHPKKGAVLLASRTNAPILPVYVSMRTRPWQPVTVVIGEPYMIEFVGKRANDAELEQATVDMMNKIYALGDPT